MTVEQLIQARAQAIEALVRIDSRLHRFLAEIGSLGHFDFFIFVDECEHRHDNGELHGRTVSWRLPPMPIREYDTLPRHGVAGKRVKKEGWKERAGKPSPRATAPIFPERLPTRTSRKPGSQGMSNPRSYSKHQQKIIKNYYDNRGAISLQRLSELVTDLYLAEGKARETKWRQAVGALEKMGIPQKQIDQLRQQDNPALLAKLVEEVMAKE
jgi:hypothetical protein